MAEVDGYVYFVRQWQRRGIMRARVIARDDRRQPDCIQVDLSSHYCWDCKLWVRPQDVADTREEAIRMATALKTKKIMSLLRQAGKLQKMILEVHDDARSIC